MYKDKCGTGYENSTRAIFQGAGEYDIPIIEPTKITENNFIGFNEVLSSKQNNCGVHFFLDDYQFQRLWNTPDRYIEKLQNFNCVLSPDFSLYTDYPTALQIYNHYRKHWIGAYLQLYGIEVIPTICWSDEKSFEWCFDGEPIGGTVAVSSVGTQKNKIAKELFLKGYKEMIERLQPETIIFYGRVPEECEENIINIKSFQEKFRRSE